MENEKKNKSVILIVVLVILVVCLGGYIFYDKVIQTKNDKESTTNINDSNNNASNIDNQGSITNADNNSDEDKSGNTSDNQEETNVLVDVKKRNSEVESFLKKTLQDGFKKSFGTGAAPSVEKVSLNSMDCTENSCVADYKLYLSIYETEICDTYKGVIFTNIISCKKSYLEGTHRLNVKTVNGGFEITNKEKEVTGVDTEKLSNAINTYFKKYLTDKFSEQYGTGATPIIKRLTINQITDCSNLNECKVVYSLVLQPYEAESCDRIYREYDFTNIYECENEWLEGEHTFKVTENDGKYTVTSNFKKTSLDEEE